jgi:putative glycosyltransferase (TIGR04348 family)
MHRDSLVIVTPALADANNGNWQTARRWARLLAPAYRVRLMARWPEASMTAADSPPGTHATAAMHMAGGERMHRSAAAPAGPGEAPGLLLALHARRSAASIAAWRQAHPQAPLVVALTGTDLYRDIETDADAQRSLELADALIVLNELGAQRLPPALRGKCHLVLQSCSQRQTLPKPQGPRSRLRAVMVGHLREEKDPRTLFDAVRQLAARMGPGGDLRVDHIGRALDPALGEAAQALAAQCPGYRWLGGLTHEQARRRIQAAHVLVHTSRMEGGAHVVMEAVRSGTPVIASRIDGNVGLLGADYPGYFPAGDAVTLARLLARAQDDRSWLQALAGAAAQRAELFSAEAEQRALMEVLARARPAYPLR